MIVHVQKRTYKFQVKSHFYCCCLNNRKMNPGSKQLRSNSSFCAGPAGLHHSGTSSLIIAILGMHRLNPPPNKNKNKIFALNVFFPRLETKMSIVFTAANMQKPWPSRRDCRVHGDVQVFVRPRTEMKCPCQQRRSKRIPTRYLYTHSHRYALCISIFPTLHTEFCIVVLYIYGAGLTR